MPMTVAQISEHADPTGTIGGQQAGGQNIYVRDLVLALSRHGITNDVFTHRDSRLAQPTVRLGTKARIIRIEAGFPKFIPKDQFGPLVEDFANNIRSYADSKSRHYNLIHAHYYYSGLIAAKIKEQMGIPFIQTFHSLGWVKEQALGLANGKLAQRIVLEREVAHAADAIIATTPEEKLVLMKQYNVPAQKIHVVPAGISPSRFSPIDKQRARRMLKLPDVNIVLFAARLEQRKGAMEFLEAVRQLTRTSNNPFYAILLSGDPRRRSAQQQTAALGDKIRRFIKTHRLEKQVSFLPCQPQELLRYYYAAADVTCVPSWYEPFGLVAVESMAMGTPVVASAVGGLKWTVQDDLTGFTVPPKRPKQLARAIQRVFNDPKLHHRLSVNSLIFVRKNFQWPEIARQITHVYRKLAKS